jgi:hypothetical protein
MSGADTRAQTPLDEEGLRPGDVDRIIADVTSHDPMIRVGGNVHMSLASTINMVTEIIARKQEMRIVRAKEVEDGRVRDSSEQA